MAKKVAPLLQSSVTLAVVFLGRGAEDPISQLWRVSPSQTSVGLPGKRVCLRWPSSLHQCPHCSLKTHGKAFGPQSLSCRGEKDWTGHICRSKDGLDKFLENCPKGCGGDHGRSPADDSDCA